MIATLGAIFVSVTAGVTVGGGVVGGGVVVVVVSAAGAVEVLVGLGSSKLAFIRLEGKHMK